MTIKEIAKLAGVSISTVSKIVNHKDENINPKTRSRVLNIVKEYNYTPYGGAKQLSGARNFVIGVLLQSAPKTNQLLNGIIECAGKNGYGVMVCDSLQSVDQELKNITSLCRHKVDGVIWEPVCANSTGCARYFSEQGIPFCAVNGPDGFESKNSYRINFMKMGYFATQALIDRRHVRPGCLLKDGSARSAAVFEGFRKCLFDHQISFTDTMHLCTDREGWYSDIISRQLSGIVSSHYDLSIQLIEQLDRLRYRLPYELSLVSLRDDVRESLRFPGISSIRIPYQEFGEFVCRQLIAICEGGPLPCPEFETPCTLENTLTLDIPLSSRTRKIVAVGSINIDVTLNVDELPQPGKTIITNMHSVIPGGKGANQAVGAAKLGADVFLIGKVGNDYYASMIYGAMKEYRVDSGGITRDPGSETGKAYIHVRGDGESTITILQGANQRLTPADIRSCFRLFENAGYCLLQTEIPLDAVLEAAKTARRRGAKTILKPATLKEIDRSLMQYIDIFVPNEQEASVLAPNSRNAEEQAAHFRKMGADVVIITLGHRGCYLEMDGCRRHFPAPALTAVDTTGAADAFIAALAVYLLRGNAMERSIEAASCAAGFCISRQGVIPALADGNSLETYLKKSCSDVSREQAASGKQNLHSNV